MKKIKEDIINYITGFYKNKELKKSLENFFGYGIGLTMLFYGPSGTGKTMLANALANYFNKKLFCFKMNKDEWFYYDRFSNIIKEIFTKASLANGIVFFDECEDILKEGSSNSREFLIEIERANCITILATNNPEDLDPAIDRRIFLKVKFNIPDANERYLIWKNLLPPFVKLGNDINLKEISEKFTLTGGLIKNAILMAINKSLQKSLLSESNEVLIEKEELYKAIYYQIDSLFKNNEEKLYIPRIDINSFTFSEKEKQKMRNIVNLIKNRTKFNCFINCKNIQTANKYIEAIANECDYVIRKFSLSFLLGISNQNERDKGYHRKNLYNDENRVEHVFSRKTGKKSILIIEDAEEILKTLTFKTNKVFYPYWYKIVNKIQEYKGVIFLISVDVSKELVAKYFQYYMEMPVLSDDIQIKYWKKLLPEEKEVNIKRFVKNYPMNIEEINDIYEKTKIAKIIENNKETVLIEDIVNMINKLNSKKVPVLFGRR